MSKLSTLTDAVASIQSGSHIALPGFAITRCAMAFSHEIIRQGKNHLTLSQCVGAMDADIIVGAGLADRLIYGGGSLDRFGRLNCINRGIENNTLIAEEYSSLSITFRFLAGSLGIPFIPTRSIRGSDLLKKIKARDPSEVANIKDPFTGENWLVIRPLLPDVAIALVQVSDEEGNAWILGPRWDNVEQIKASKRTIVIAEKIVSTEIIRQNAERTVIPGFLVSHVVHVPYAAHPNSMYGVYDYDAEHIKLYASATQTPESFQDYLEKYVFSVKTHEEYLKKVGGDELLKRIKANPKLGY
jgi:acyl CoA:acetate/3-ketoacid CoA transferase alpha subunit